MAKKMFFVSSKSGRRYEVISFNKETGDIVLRGQNAPFPDKYDKARYQELGYTLVTEDVPDTEVVT